MGSGKKSTLTKDQIARLLEPEFSEVQEGQQQLARCGICPNLKPMKLAKVAAHRQSQGHQRCLQERRLVEIMRAADPAPAGPARNRRGERPQSPPLLFGPASDDDDELHGSLLFQNPRDLTSVRQQRMTIGFAKAAVRRLGVPAKNDSIPTQKAFDNFKLALRTELHVPPIKEVHGASGNTFFSSSIKAAVMRDFRNVSVRKEMLLYPRLGPTISAFQDGDFFHELPASMTGPCAISRDGKPIFLSERLVLDDGRVACSDKWTLNGNNNVVGKGHLLDADLQPNYEEPVTFELSAVRGRHEIRNDHPFRRGDRPLFSIPILLQCDDLSGVPGKRLNPHIQVSFQNAALSPQALAKESNVHLFSVSMEATTMEMITEFVAQLK
ncbi:hypothetical protein OC842_000451 [Tilletia horrida]|uniref:Uncharacterized protein n=1 Tax=Tilletia horrida TaxID=155126 RepID=A0AAN6JPK0_9BASI|nr:hypothetical protein OC842_000451 [Tilletia horrida]